MSSKKTLLVVDISSFIFRAFYAIRQLTSPEGVPVNAVYGVLSMLLKAVEKLNPTHMILARDTSKKTFRHEIYNEYKANRSEPPDDLKPQFEIIRQLIEKLQLTGLAIEGYEADDIIGSVCTQWKDQFDDILIVSGDKDLMQFVDEKIKMVDTMKDVVYDREAIFNKMGVWPEQIHDYLSIVGDSSDNIPGLSGIGPKGAIKLLEEFKTLENCLKNVDKLKGKKVIEAFTEHADMAILSKKLTEIKTDIELGVNPDSTLLRLTYSPELDSFLKGLGFKNIIQKVIETTHRFAGDTVSQVPSTRTKHKFEIILLRNLLQVIADWSTLYLFIDWCKDSKNPKRIILKSESNEVPVLINLDQSNYLEFLKLFFVDLEKRTLFTSDIKSILNCLSIAAIQNKHFIYEIEQLHFLIEPDSGHSLPRLLARYSQHFSESDLLSSVDEDFINVIFCLEEASTALLHKVKTENLLEIYELIDYPLFDILSKMEFFGVNIDLKYLKELEVKFSKQLEELELNIEKISGSKINLKSPKQVSGLLFDLLKLPVIKKTKTGNSTDHEVLEELASRNISPVPDLLITFREVEKLLSTYIKALPELISPADFKLHTTFSQSTAATGRLASSNPNLQNIPTRTENGRLIRKAFNAAPGKVLFSADYSQVELRLLAHFSEDPTMLKAFRDNLDIHRQTASEIMGVPLDQVTREQRSMAKAVNFGLMYGQSSFGLSTTLRISRYEAKEYITRYFTRFSNVKAYLDSLKEYAEIHGHSKTLHGRKRFLPDINSSNRTIKSQAERVAINSPIQGTAADIIKLAMIKISKVFQDKNFSSKMILQVHDELIFECDVDELVDIRSLVRHEMENVVQLKVPLLVDTGEGLNWFDLK
jgi:DNA polymerase-1